MLSTDKLVIVCAGKDTLKASSYCFQLLQLCIGVGKGMSLRRLYLPAKTSNDILGLSDIGISEGNISICVDSIVYEVRKYGFKAVFADFEHLESEVVSEFLSKLDDRLNKEKIKFFVPICNEFSVKYAVLVTQSALSGGNLEEYISSLLEKYPNRIAVSIRPICTDFALPSKDSEGTPISDEERMERIKKYDSGVFFSSDLCAKYFTYMDENENGHFVIFDDDSTISAKIQRLNALDIDKIFALYPHVQNLLAN